MWACIVVPRGTYDSSVRSAGARAASPPTASAHLSAGVPSDLVGDWSIKSSLQPSGRPYIPFDCLPLSFFLRAYIGTDALVAPIRSLRIRAPRSALEDRAQYHFVLSRALAAAVFVILWTTPVVASIRSAHRCKSTT